MKTHSHENYNICPYPECGKRYAHEYKLKNHIASHHEKPHSQNAVDAPTPRYAPTPVPLPPVEKLIRTPKLAVSGPSSGPSSDRPYACPYEGCEKAYIHEYKLNLHLRREHPGHFPEKNFKSAANNENEMDEGSDQDAYGGKRVNGKLQKQNRPKPNIKLPPSKVPQRKNHVASPANMNNVGKKLWPVKDEIYEQEEEDSEETEEERDDVGEGWRYRENNNDEDDEETEDED